MKSLKDLREKRIKEIVEYISQMNWGYDELNHLLDHMLQTCYYLKALDDVEALIREFPKCLNCIDGIDKNRLLGEDG